ncbi:hypothetical protein BJ912DRAFT_995134 [Pholiota molesta]|nr:hypothetical protein BJ912DRAFT_995134 [Pholiota molesta]
MALHNPLLSLSIVYFSLAIHFPVSLFFVCVLPSTRSCLRWCLSFFVFTLGDAVMVMLFMILFNLIILLRDVLV